jgi:hypothetical protein
LVDLYLLVLGLSQLFNGQFSTFRDKNRSVPEHSLVPFGFVLDLCDLLQSFIMLLLVDVMDDHSVISLDHLSVSDALIDLPMALEHLEYGFFVYMVFVVLQEVSKALHFPLVNFFELLFVLQAHFFRFFLRNDVVDLVQLQLDNPSAKQKFLWATSYLVLLLEHDLKD